MSTAEHWRETYAKRPADRVSWFEARPDASLALLGRADVASDAPLLDVGGGASTLVDHLLDAGHTDVTVLDIAPGALEASRARLGPRAGQVRWLVGDVLQAELGGPYAAWHDRAVFHFLVDADAQDAYLRQLDASLREGGVAVIATFADDGPERCSGLPVARYSPDALAARLSPALEPLALERHTHVTPGGAEQRFVYGLFRRTRRGGAA